MASTSSHFVHLCSHCVGANLTNLCTACDSKGPSCLSGALALYCSVPNVDAKTKHNVLMTSNRCCNFLSTILQCFWREGGKEGGREGGKQLATFA